MKIGILTYHSSINEGAVLQAYALQEVCKDIANDSVVEIIDIRSKKILKRDFLECFKCHTNLISILLRLVKYFKIHRFMKSKLNLSKDSYIGDNYRSGIGLINEQKYDVIIVGSDEVWKVGLNKNMERGFPNVYWLHDVHAKIKASYAATAHKTIYEQLPEDKKKFISKALGKIDYIGVRDRLTYELVKKAINSECIDDNRLKIVMDPTFLYDFSDELSVLKKRKTFADKYVCLICENKKVSDLVCKYFNEKNIRVVSAGYYNEGKSINICDLNPLEWIDIIKRSIFCVTDRFHGTVFSIKYKVPFMAIDHNKAYIRHESKIKYLLQTLQLSQMLLDLSNNNYNDAEVLKMLDDLYNNGERLVSEIEVQNEVTESLSFLTDVLNKAQLSSLAGSF